MNSQKFPFRVIRVGQPDSDYGQHKTFAGAQKRIGVCVAHSNGKLDRTAFAVVADSSEVPCASGKPFHLIEADAHGHSCVDCGWIPN